MENEIKSLKEIIENMQKELYDIKEKSDISKKLDEFKKDIQIEVLSKYFENSKKEEPKKEEPKEEPINVNW